MKVLFVAHRLCGSLLSITFFAPSNLFGGPCPVRALVLCLAQFLPCACGFFFTTSTPRQLTSHLSFHAVDTAISYCRILAHNTLQQFQTEHDAHSRRNSHPFHRSLLNTRQTCLTEADTAAAVAVVTVATPTGTKTATLDTAAAPVTTTHPAIMHRMGRTIHPLAREGHQCGGFLGSPCSFAISLFQGFARSLSPRLCLLYLPCRSSVRSRTCCNSVEFSFTVSLLISTS